MEPIPFRIASLLPNSTRRKMGIRYLTRSLLTTTRETLAARSYTVSSSPPNSSYVLLLLRCHFARGLSTSSTSSSLLNDPNRIRANRPGCDYEHWVVVMERPVGKRKPTQDEILDSYIKTLSMVVGSEEEARMKIYSVRFLPDYYAFGALVSEELSHKLKELPRVRSVRPDSYVNIKNKTYGGDSFINGQVVPYKPRNDKEQMAPVWCNFETIDETRQNWVFKARVLQYWEIMHPQRNAVDSAHLILVDDQGVRIHAVLGSMTVMQKHRNTFRKNKVLIVTNIWVKCNDLSELSIEHEYVLNFLDSTKVLEIEDPLFPISIYQAKPFYKLFNNSIHVYNYIFDVVGEVVQKGPLYQRPWNNTTVDAIDFILRDEHNIEITCTLTRKNANKLNRYYESVTDEAVIVILFLCRAEYSGGCLRLIDAECGTEVILNADAYEVRAFLARLGRQCHRGTDDEATICYKVEN